MISPTVRKRQLSQTERTPNVILLSLSSGKGLWGKYYYALYHALVVFRCGVYKHCCLVNETVWCWDELQSASTARTIPKLLAAGSVSMTDDNNKLSMGARFLTFIKNWADCSDWCLTNPLCTAVEWTDEHEDCTLVQATYSTWDDPPHVSVRRQIKQYEPCKC